MICFRSADAFCCDQVKPCVAQINMNTCCTVPPEMQEFAKEHDIQLLTHNDPQGAVGCEIEL